MIPLVIFDLDGTLALIDHRKHLIEGKEKNWKEFYARCVDDKPNRPVIRTAVALKSAGFELWVFTGRSDEVVAQTAGWISRYCGGLFDCLKMRMEGDHTPDSKLKMIWLDAMNDYDRERLVCVYEDRGRVVDSWRAAGVPCFQVAAGDF